VKVGVHHSVHGHAVLLVLVRHVILRQAYVRAADLNERAIHGARYARETVLLLEHVGDGLLRFARGREPAQNTFVNGANRTSHVRDVRAQFVNHKIDEFVRGVDHAALTDPKVRGDRANVAFVRQAVQTDRHALRRSQAWAARVRRLLVIVQLALQPRECLASHAERLTKALVGVLFHEQLEPCGRLWYTRREQPSVCKSTLLSQPQCLTLELAGSQKDEQLLQLRRRAFQALLQHESRP
jgi:hypothetical protein